MKVVVTEIKHSNFVEEEHPRDKDGKFAVKNDLNIKQQIENTKTVLKNKQQRIDEIEDDMYSIMIKYEKPYSKKTLEDPELADIDDGSTHFDHDGNPRDDYVNIYKDLQSYIDDVKALSGQDVVASEEDIKLYKELYDEHEQILGEIEVLNREYSKLKSALTQKSKNIATAVISTIGATAITLALIKLSKDRKVKPDDVGHTVEKMINGNWVKVGT